MLELEGLSLMTDVEPIIDKLRFDLSKKGIPRFAKIIRTPNNLMTCCPFHKEGQERKPSFGISEQNGVCHCFGCGWIGSLEEMISLCLGHNDGGLYGQKWLASNFLSVEVENRPDINLSFSRNSEINKKEIKYISEDELDSYRYIHPYMYKRKMTDEIIEIFDIGYDKDTNCITFPVRDINGNTLFIARRSVQTKFFNYPVNVEKPVYGLYEIMRMKTSKFKELFPNEFICDECIICESMIDALTCWVYGKPAIALNGLGNDLQFKQLNSMPFRKFILATDMDEAGLKARARIKKALKNKVVTEYFWDLNIAKDINDMTEEYFKNLEEKF